MPRVQLMSPKQITLLLILLLHLASHASQHIIFPQGQSSGDTRFDDMLALLKQSLEVTRAQFGDYDLTASKLRMTESRYLLEAQKGKLVNVVFSSTSKSKEEQLIPVRIPLRKGLLGYRIFLIHKNNQARLANITNIQQLKKLVAGQGHDWGDNAVYQHHQFALETSANYESLFKMLVHHRFDYFPRGINEVFKEFEQRSAELPELAVEQKLLLYYPWPYYIFVSKQHPDIAERIAAGLKIMIENGSFDEIFNRYHADTIKRSGVANRRLLKLDNPLLPDATPFDNQTLWFNPLSIQ